MKQTPSFEVGTEVSNVVLNQEHLDIPIEVVLETQKSLMYRMLPNDLEVSSIPKSDGENIGAEDNLFERWLEKYSESFRMYCDEIDPSSVAGEKLIERIQSGELTDEDYVQIQKYLMDRLVKTDAMHTKRVGPFFDSAEEFKEFKGTHLH